MPPEAQASGLHADPRKAGVRMGPMKLPEAGDTPRMLEAMGQTSQPDLPKLKALTLLTTPPWSPTQGTVRPAGASHPHSSVVLCLPHSPRRLRPEPTQAPGATGVPAAAIVSLHFLALSPYLVQEAQGKMAG